MSRLTNYMRVLSLGVPIEAFTLDIWLLCVSNTISALSDGFYSWTFPLYIRSLQADYVQLGLVLSSLNCVSIFAPLLGGYLADRFDRRKIIILSWIPWVFTSLIYSLAENWVQLIPGTMCWGMAFIGVPSVNVYIVSSIPDRKKLASVLSFFWSTYSFGYIFSPTIGSYLVTIIGMRRLLQLSTLLAVLATAVILPIHSQHPSKEEKTRRQLISSTEEKRLWRRMLFWASFLGVATFFTSIARSYVPTFLAEEIKLTEVYIGLFGSINFAGRTFISIALGRLGDKWRKSGAIGVCLVLYTGASVPLLLIRDPVALMFVAFVFGGAMVPNFLVSSYIGAIAPENKRGLWMSIPQALSMLAAFIAPYLGGYLYTLSPYYAFMVSIPATLFLALFALVRLRE